MIFCNKAKNTVSMDLTICMDNESITNNLGKMSKSGKKYSVQAQIKDS